MEEHLCAECGANLRPTATYCLGCDTPVAGAERGLSVADTQVVRTGRPISVVVLGVVCLAVIAGAGWATMHLWNGHVDTSASDAARKSVAAIVRAEGGKSKACTTAATAIVGSATTEQQACTALVDDDPGAHLVGLRAAHVDRHGRRGTVELTGTLVDDSGRHAFDRIVHVVEDDNKWWLDWDGSPVARG